MSGQRSVKMGGIKTTNIESKPIEVNVPYNTIRFVAEPSKTKKTKETKPTRPPFDPSSVPYPTSHEITKSYGGHYYFMLSYNLKMYDEEDFEYSKQILEEIKRQVYEDRVETAKEEYERGV